MQVGSDEFSNVQFNTTTAVDFSFSSSFNPTEVSVYQIDENTNEPIYYLLKKQVKATSGTVKLVHLHLVLQRYMIKLEFKMIVLSK
jgi:hypothetical protein